MQDIEKKYQNGQEELEDLRKKVKDLRSTYKNTMLEIQNLNHEFEDEKENLFEDLRQQTIENEFLIGLLEIAIPIQELENIKKKSVYDEINKKWIIPEFYVENKQTLFPKINAEVKTNKPGSRNQKESKKKIRNDEYFSDYPEIRYENMIGKDPLSPNEENEGISKNNNLFREHFQFIGKNKKEVASSHNELPPVLNTNKKFIADGFAPKRKFRYK